MGEYDELVKRANAVRFTARNGELVGLLADAIEALQADKVRLKKFAAFSRSVILSGERWSSTCDEMFDAAMREERDG